jgi:hypothetical protein
MAITFDGTAKIIALDGALSVSVQAIYSRWVDWFAVSSNSKFLPAFRTIGDPAGADGYALPVIAFLLNGWRIRPLGGAYELTLDGGILVAPVGASAFADVVSGQEPKIRYSQPVQAIAYSTSGGAALTAEQIAAAILAAAQVAPIHADVQRVNNIEIIGTGVAGDSMRPAP